MDKLKEILSSDTFQKINRFYENGKLTHAYLFLGEDEKSVKDFSFAVAQKLVCDYKKPCLTCDNCKKMLAGFHPDVLIYPKGKSFLVSDSEDIIRQVNIKPIESSYKVFIINRFDDATVQSQNKLLKTIEETPKNVVFLINAVNGNSILPTIKSRTETLEIQNYNIKPLESEEDYPFLIDMLKNMTSTKKIVIYTVKFAEKSGFLTRLKLLAEIFEQMLLDKNLQKGTELGQVGTEFENGAICDILQKLNEAKRMLDANVSPNLITDTLLIKILEIKYLWNKNK